MRVEGGEVEFACDEKQYRRRHLNNIFALMPCSRASFATETPGSHAASARRRRNSGLWFGLPLRVPDAGFSSDPKMVPATRKWWEPLRRLRNELPRLGYGLGDRHRRRAESPVAPTRSVWLALELRGSLKKGAQRAKERRMLPGNAIRTCRPRGTTRADQIQRSLSAFHA